MEIEEKIRIQHLQWLLYFMIPTLIRQNIIFSFYIINQETLLLYTLTLSVTLNKGSRTFFGNDRFQF